MIVVLQRPDKRGPFTQQGGAEEFRLDMVMRLCRTPERSFYGERQRGYDDGCRGEGVGDVEG